MENASECIDMHEKRIQTHKKRIKTVKTFKNTGFMKKTDFLSSPLETLKLVLSP